MNKCNFKMKLHHKEQMNPKKNKNRNKKIQNKLENNLCYYFTQVKINITYMML